jgi:hypothetical protein
MTHRWFQGTAGMLVGATALLVGCSSVPIDQREAAQRARFESYASKPVEQFTWLGRYYSWQYLGKTSEQNAGKTVDSYEIVLWTTPFEAYLMKVMPPCEDLPFALAIGLTSTVRTVSSHFDFVLVHHAGEERHLPWRCPIREIRPVDYRRMQHDLKMQPQPEKEQVSGS